MNIHRVALIQAAPVLFNIDGTLDKLGMLASEAAHQGSKLAVFPEAFISAYPKGLGFGARMGMRSSEGREEFRRYFESAIVIPGPSALLPAMHWALY